MAHGAPTVSVFARERKKQLQIRRQLVICPSAWWMREVDIQNSTSRKKAKAVFPPQADQTPMVTCESDPRTCGRMYPFYYGSGCQCEDCLEVERQRKLAELRKQGLAPGPLSDEERMDPNTGESYTTSSPSADGFQHLAEINGRVVDQIEMLPEDDESLHGQVEHYQEMARLHGEDVARRTIVFS